MSQIRKRIYCAGPLFTGKEREEMAQLADALQEAHFDTFLPQEDGLELAVSLEALSRHGIDRSAAASMLARAIFALDVYQVVEGCDGVVVNLNGRVPDEGAVSEAAIGWCFGQPIVGYKADPRSLFAGQDNPLVAGLFDFQLCSTIQETVSALKQAFEERPSGERRAKWRSQQIRGYLDFGREVFQALRAGDESDALEKLAAMLRERFAGAQRTPQI